MGVDKVEVDSDARKNFEFMTTLRCDFHIIQSTTCIRVLTRKQTEWQPSHRLSHVDDSTACR